MFERFTHPARTVVTRAVAEAESTRAARVTDVHLLLALLDTAEPSLADLLGDLGVDARDLARDVRSAERSTTGRAGLDDADLAALGSLGIDADEVLGRAEDLLGSPEDDPAPVEPNVRPRLPWRPGRPAGHPRFAAKRVLEQALRQALDLQHREISSDDLLLGLLAADGAAAGYLRRAGVDLSAARAAVQRARRRAG